MTCHWVSIHARPRAGLSLLFVLAEKAGEVSETVTE